MTDSFCHYVDIIEAAVYQVKTLKTLPAFVMANRICEIFVNFPVQQHPFEENKTPAPLNVFFTRWVHFLKSSILNDILSSDLVNVLFNELMESVQKLLSTVANLQQSLSNPSGDSFTLTNQDERIRGA